MSKSIFCVFLLISSFTCYSQGFKPGEVWKDTDGQIINAHGGGILYQNGTYYWYGESRGAKKTDGVSCYSSKDLYQWKNEGIALQVVRDTTSLLQYGCLIERPKVIYNQKTGKYVMWFHHELKDQGYRAALTGLAVADKANGPFTYVKSLRPHQQVWPTSFPESQRDTGAVELPERSANNWKEGVIMGKLVQRDFKEGQMSRDMTLFVDDDHSAYHIASSEDNQTLHISRLSADYLSFDTEYHRVLPGGSNEAPALVKHQNRYFLIASGTTGWKPNPARSFVAESIYGEWKSLGNPVVGSEGEKATTFYSQSTYVLPVQGERVQYVYMGDRWNAKDLKDSRYIWLPITFENDRPVIRWIADWELD